MSFLYSKKEKSDVTNYRPVSLLCIPSKIFEHMLFKPLYKHCEKYFHNSQYGFRKNLSPIIQLITFLQKVYEGIASRQEIDIIFTDFSKAFDKVDHAILLKKIHDIGIRGKLFKVLKSYISGRTQKVRVANELSEEFLVTSGVPQGSILSPLLFLIFINDLPNQCENIFSWLFADDAKFVSIGLPVPVIQNDLDAIQKWTDPNNLPFNKKKCRHMEIGDGQKQLKFGEEIIQKTSIKIDLGLIISDDMKWNEHIDMVCLKAIRVFYMIKRNVSNLTAKAKLNLYKSMIVPILLYGSPCYGMSKYVMSELESVQRRVVNWIKFGDESYKDKLSSISILPLPMYIQINNLLLLSKMLSGRYETPMLKIPVYTDFSRYSLFQLKRPNRKILEEDFFFQTCRLADALRLDLRDQIGLKKKLLQLFWREFKNYDQGNKCSWRLACDCTQNNCRNKTTI